jgi:transposase-like protein
MGRPTDYKPEYVEQAAKQCEEGATDQELADFFDVSVRTLYRWKNTYPEFCQALKASKAPADERVVRSLFERAVGYERDEVDIRVVNGEIVQTPIRKFYPPDTTAAIFWLKNRQPAAWKDKLETTHEVGESVTKIVRQIVGV